MPDINYKKGELLFNETITTTYQNSWNMYMSVCTTIINQGIVIIDFNEVEYICSLISIPPGMLGYGGFSEVGPTFINYPFLFMNGHPSETTEDYMFAIYTENPGTYSLKIYEAIEGSESDSESDISNESVTIRSYINKNLPNLNWNILPQIFESEGVELTEDIEKYLRETPGNTNWNLFRSLLKEKEDSPVIFDLLLTQGVDYNNTTLSDDMKSRLYQLSKDKFIAGKSYEYRCYFNEEQCNTISQMAEETDSMGPHRIQIGNSYSSTFIKLLDEESAYGTISSLCASNNYCRIVLIEN